MVDGHSIGSSGSAPHSCMTISTSNGSGVSGEVVPRRDLPSLYGIRDVQELDALFTTLTHDTAGHEPASGTFSST